jgi:hypothetical protein
LLAPEAPHNPALKSSEEKCNELFRGAHLAGYLLLDHHFLPISRICWPSGGENACCPFHCRMLR